MKLIVKISPHYSSEKLENPTLDDLIDVFEDRLYGWHLDWADYLNKEEHAGFAVLQLSFSYFEAIAIYETGEGSDRRSKKYFQQSLIDVFPELLKYEAKIIEQIADLIYRDGRCGFYHAGMAKKSIILHEAKEPIGIDVNNDEVKNIRIDRLQFIESIKRHASGYIYRLRDPQNIQARNNFTKGWNIFHQ